MNSGNGCRAAAMAFILAAGAAVAQTTWLVWENGSDTYPYDTWDRAATSIQTAVDAAEPGDTVLVTNGIYSLGGDTVNRVVIANAITLRGVGADQATISGGTTRRPLWINAAGAVVEGFTIIDGRHNSNPSSGAGVLMNGGTLRDCVISNNVASARQTRGGGVYMTGGTLEDCLLFANQAAGGDGNAYGAAVYADAGAIIRRCRILGNTASADRSNIGGAVYLVNNSTLQNCLIHHNRSLGYTTPTPGAGPLSAGVYSAGTGNRVEYCTIVGNTMQYGVGVGLNLYRGRAVNNIVYFNHAEFRGDYRLDHQNAYATPNRTDTTISNTCAYPLVAGGGNTAADPLFADWPAGDFTLLPGSPCLDSAAVVAGVTTDYEGTVREADGDGDGTGSPDMGALEALAAGSGPLRCGLVSADREGLTGVNASFEAIVAGSDTNGIVIFWDFDNDGVHDATGRTAEHAYGLGRHTVSLTASNAMANVSLVRADEIRVAPVLVHVLAGGAHVFPFDTSANAATNVQAALNAALATDTAATEVRVGNGHYKLTRQVIVDKGILLRSANGATNTIFDAQAVSGRRVLELFDGAANARVEGFTLTRGSLPTLQYGAGLNLFGGTVATCIISNNLVSGRNASQGAGVRMMGGLLLACDLLNNQAAGSDGTACGGGVYAAGGVVDRCRIQGNQATATSSAANGGGVYLLGSAALRNCLVAGNRVNNTAGTHLGGGVYAAAAGTRVENCTITDNYIATGSGAGLYLHAGVVANTVVWRNYLVGYEDNLSDHKNYVIVGGTIGSSASYPLPGGSGNIDDDPLFVNRAAGDYRLSLGSPAIDAGVPLATVINDLSGTPRPLDGDGDDVPAFDMGAYEFDWQQIEALTCGFSAAPVQGVDTLETVFTAVVEGPGAAAVVYQWDFENDGIVDLSGPARAVVTNTYGIGVHSVSLRVTNAVEGTWAVHVKHDYVQVAPSCVYVTTNGAHVSPFHTWASAATNIHAAVGTVASGGEVVIGDGVYGITNQVQLSRPVTVRSLNGAGRTIVRRVSGTTRVLHINDPQARVEGLTLRDGMSASLDYGGGVYLAAGTLRGCIVVGNYASGRFNHGGGIYLAAGCLVESCLVIGNLVNGSDWGYGGGIYVAGGTVRNCTVTGNSAADTGGGIYRSAGTVTNTIAFANEAMEVAGLDDVYGSTAAFAYCCSPDLIGGEAGNITADPQFKNGGVGYGLAHLPGDYHLATGSPCRNTGAAQPWMAGATDLDGRPRQTGFLVDRGCYEAASGGTVLILR